MQITPSFSIYLTQLHHPLQHNIIDFLARHHLFPEAYLYGWIDILSIPDFRPTFLFGHLYGTHQWFFFPAVFLVKTTLALLVFLLLLPFARIIGRRRALVFFALPAVFFFLVCIASGMNMGARYLIPMYPFCILLAAASAAAFFDRSRISRIAVSALLVLTLISALHAYPNFLVYSNELFGGPSTPIAPSPTPTPTGARASSGPRPTSTSTPTPTAGSTTTATPPSTPAISESTADPC